MERTFKSNNTSKNSKWYCHVRDSLRKTEDGGGLVLMEFFVVNPYFVSNGEKLPLIFRKIIVFCLNTILFTRFY